MVMVCNGNQRIYSRLLWPLHTYFTVIYSKIDKNWEMSCHLNVLLKSHLPIPHWVHRMRKASQWIHLLADAKVPPSRQVPTRHEAALGLQTGVPWSGMCWSPLRHYTRKRHKQLLIVIIR